MVMRPLRAILALLFPLLFLAAANSCALATLFPGKVDTCCELECSAPEELPCKGSECPPCTTLKVGANVAALQPLSLPAPVFAEDDLFLGLWRVQLTECAGEARARTTKPPAAVSPPWLEVVTKALPVRGPSIAA